ncbi:hypothetical protein HYS99_01625 [Candidatus Giovannonibacteria bacterium]|nr:hypothetical protein [Candidatus Giovannonibacteria bacterium]
MQLLPRLKPDSAFLANTLLSKGEVPQWATYEMQKKVKQEASDLIDFYLKRKAGYDLYLAASLRCLEDFMRAEQVVSFLEKNLHISIVHPGGLGISLDTPEKDSSNEKGDLERFFLDRSSTLLMIDAEKATWGKYAEAMTMLLRQMQVVMYTEDKSTAFILKERHPLKTLGGFGGSCGYHVVTSLGEILTCLKWSLTICKMDSCSEKQVNGADGQRRAYNSYCPNCGSLIRRTSFWISNKRKKVNKQ